MMLEKLQRHVRRCCRSPCTSSSSRLPEARSPLIRQERGNISNLRSQDCLEWRPAYFAARIPPSCTPPPGRPAWAWALRVVQMTGAMIISTDTVHIVTLARAIQRSCMRVLRPKMRSPDRHGHDKIMTDETREKHSLGVEIPLGA